MEHENNPTLFAPHISQAELLNSPPNSFSYAQRAFTPLIESGTAELSFCWTHIQECYLGETRPATIGTVGNLEYNTKSWKSNYHLIDLARSPGLAYM